MNEFQKNYSTMLLKQVNEEIAYLIRHNHHKSNVNIYIPCLFCTPRENGFYTCDRFDQLSEFRLNILQKEVNITKSRRVIGREQPISIQQNTHDSEMPLLSVKL